MAADIFHRDFKAAPWWWEWWHPSNELSQDPPLKTDVLVVGAGYGGLSTALELRRNGIEAIPEPTLACEPPRLLIEIKECWRSARETAGAA